VSRVSVVPFPIHHPVRWQHYCPSQTTQFVRLFSDWGRQKLHRLEAHGWPVEVLDAGNVKQVSGRDIRQKIISGQSWQTLMPAAVAEILTTIDAERRLKND
jgi:nicotinamide-nucleotide adenylyltransferase